MIKRKKFKVTREADQIKKMQKLPKREFLWRGIPEGSVGIINGVAKTGKTTWTENLAISLAVGKPEFFNYKLPGVPKKVLFLNLEESYLNISERREKQLKRLNEKELEAYERNFLGTPDGFPTFIDSETDWEILRDYCDDCGPAVICIDSLTHLFKGSIEKSAECRDFIQKFDKYIRRPNRTCIIVHHNVKGNNRPMDMHCVAGSRVITAFFEFSFGLANIPTRSGGNYACMLSNKHIAKDDTTAYLYKVCDDGWIEVLDEANKYDLYAEDDQKIDYRIDSKNRDKIFKYLENQTNQGNQIITTKDLKENFVHKREMSLDTLHTSLNKLVEKGKIKKEDKGKYTLFKGLPEIESQGKEGGQDE